jgi:hypothetical protein
MALPELIATFHGLIAFMPSGSDQLALCHPEGGNHDAVLAIPVKNLDLTETNGVWRPSVVLHDSAGEEVAVWSLNSQVLSIADGGNGKGTWDALPAGLDLDIVDLKAAHYGSKESTGGGLRTLTAVSSAITLTGGTFSWNPDPAKAVPVIQSQPGEADKKYKHPTSVRWKAEFDIATTILKNGRDQFIFLREDNPIALQFTNVAQVNCPDGLTHFKSYYDFLTPDIAEDAQVRLSPSTGDLEVFDCVPPHRFS